MYIVMVQFFSLKHYFVYLKHYLDPYRADTVCSESLLIFELIFLSLGVENYLPGIWGTGISDAIFVGRDSSE